MSLIEDFDEPGRMTVLGYPMHGTTLLIILHCAAMLVCVLLGTLGYGGALQFFALSRQAVLSGQVWRLFTYEFLHGPSLGFAINMAMLYWFGMGLETSIGRRSFFAFYAALIFSQSLFLMLSGHSGAINLSDFSLDGVTFGLIIAYATVYPGVGMFFGVPAKYLAYALIGISVLSCVTYHDWPDLLFLGLMSGIGHAGMRLLGIQGGFEWWDRWRETGREPQPGLSKEDEINAAVNRILDKVSSRGINSLTEAERLTLERARSALGENEGGARDETK